MLTISPMMDYNAQPNATSLNQTVITDNVASGGAGGAVYVENLNILTVICDE